MPDLPQRARAVVAATLLAAGAVASAATCDLPTRFAWTSSGIVASPQSDATHAIVGLKDPTVVRYNGQWHVYATSPNTAGQWSLTYFGFPDWPAAATATQYSLDAVPGYAPGLRAAPQLFYFTPQQKWYLISQSNGPQYSTADAPDQPSKWTAPKPFYASEPAIVTANKGPQGGWLDFWVICDATHCYLFFSDNNGHWYRSRTAIGDFPNGFGEPVIVMQSAVRIDLWEASNVYRIKGSDKYLAIVEAVSPTFRRYFRAWTATGLDGAWTPLADTWTYPFIGANNVSFDGQAPWTVDFSHGEMLRDGYDETLTVDPCNMRYLYQGLDPAHTSVGSATEYPLLPWRLGLLTQRPAPLQAPAVPALGDAALGALAIALTLFGWRRLRSRTAR